MIQRIDAAFETLSKLLLTMRRSAYVFACYAILQGTVILIGGPERFSALGYDVANHIPGSPYIWGVFIGTAGVIAFFGVKTRTYLLGGIGMIIAAVWSTMFAGAFLISAIQSPESNLTAIVAYGKDAVLFTLLAAGFRDLWHQQQKENANEDAG